MIDVKKLSDKELESLHTKIGSELNSRQYKARELKKKNCKHDWRYMGTGYHGSSKGVDSYECTLCGDYKDDK